MNSISCTICLTALDLKEDVVHSTSCGHVFHQLCLTQALRTSSSCPQCRRAHIQHFQLFFSLDTTDEDEDMAGAAATGAPDNNFLTKEFSKISKKLDSLSLQITHNNPQRDRRPNRDNGEADRNRNVVVQLRRENQDLREILEMEKILSTNTEKEIEQLKVDVRERNDLINALQIQNDNLVEESFMREPARRVPTDNLLDL